MNTELKLESELMKMNPIVQNDNLSAGLHEVLKECMGQVDLLHELVRMFKRNVLEFIGNVKVNLENEDVEKIGLASHRIKSGLRMMGIDSLLQIVEQIDSTCSSDKDLKHIRFLYNQFVDEYPEVETALDAEIKKL